MSTPCEYTLVEKPIIAYLRDELGYRYLRPSEALALRGGERGAVLPDELTQALASINGIAEDDAARICADLLRATDNETWLSHLRGGYSDKLAGDKDHRSIALLDFDRPENNRFVVTHQLEMRGHSFRIPDVVVYVNGIPLVVIEAKSAIAKQDVFDAIDDIGVYEKELPRLFESNLFNIATNGTSLRYGATGAPKEFWSSWRDPWPRPASEFEHEPMRKGLWALLEKGRLLDLLAHFVVFEKDPDSGRTIKKICRYQQFRAVNKLVARVAKGEHRKGLVWHTQGSGKSLTMAFSVLKLKFHRGLGSTELENPNIMVVTDRKDLDAQITKTFQDCGIPNPEHADSIQKLHSLIAGTPKGKVVLSTIFKAFGSDTPVENSHDWVILVDEAHRTQERDLGAYLRATFPKARMFGFTGTPVKSKDLDTRKNFGIAGEDYLDRYGIEDAVRDGATVPIRYMSRMPLWDLDGPKLDVLFDQEFAELDDALREELKARGVTKGDLARFEPRIALIAYDIWTHFTKNVQPDGMKAQIVAVDRKACTVYKRCLDEVIKKELQKSGLSASEAEERASAMSVCVYSSGGKDDLKPGNEGLVRYFLDENAEKEAIRNFKDPAHPLSFLIVCNKLLTGFDAPIEQAMYLDNYLTQHNLLQAIARINRRFGAIKDHGIVVDYIGVTKDLAKALSSYKPEDVSDAAGSDELLVDDLQKAHTAVMAMLAGATRSDDPEKDAKAGVDALGSEDEWYRFRTAAAEFLRALAAVGSAPQRLKYSADAKYVASVVAYGKLHYDQEPELDFKAYSEKIRGMLTEHLAVTGLKTLLTLPSISEVGFWSSFGADGDEADLQTAALKKASALKKELQARAAQNPAQYATLSQRIEELIEQFQKRQLTTAEFDRKTYELAVDTVRKEFEYERTGLDQDEHRLYAILTQERPMARQADAVRDFSERARQHLVTTFCDWRHDNCDTTAASFRLGHGDPAVARDRVELLVRLANAPMPAFVTDAVGEEAYAELPMRTIEAPQRLIDAKSNESMVVAAAAGWTMLGVEPLLFKLWGLLEPERAQALLTKKKGLAAIVADMQSSDCIPYQLQLSDAAFRSDEGWSERSAYANALRDVLRRRNAQAHKAPKSEVGVWYSAMAVMLGAIDSNAGRLRSQLGNDLVVAEVRTPYGEEPGLEESSLLDAAQQLAELFRDDATAPLNWQHNRTVKQELRRLVKRKIMKLVPKTKREAILDAVLVHAEKYFAKSRGSA